MNAELPVHLFDLDGVLVEPHGYRLAIQATLNYFTEKMGLGDLYPGEDAIATFEAINMTSEWDITPILLAGIFDEVVAQVGRNGLALDLPANLDAACSMVRALPVLTDLHPRVDAIRLAARLKTAFQPGLVYSEVALSLCQGEAAASLFPALTGHPLLDTILGNTRDLQGSQVTHVFQHFTLGSQVYEEVFARTRLFDTPSFLQTYDRLLIRKETAGRILSGWRSGEIAAAVYTARPSTPMATPEGAARSMFVYSPEAELVLQAAGLEEIPLVGAGQVCWLAASLGCPTERFIKPSPVQALAAIAAAVTRDPLPSLFAAEKLASTGEAGFFSGFPPLSVHVYEDSGGNVRAVRQAVDMLAMAGLTVRFTACGIADHPAKQQALLEAGARLLADINAAFQVY